MKKRSMGAIRLTKIRDLAPEDDQSLGKYQLVPKYGVTK